MLVFNHVGKGLDFREEPLRNDLVIPHRWDKTVSSVETDRRCMVWKDFLQRNPQHRRASRHEIKPLHVVQYIQSFVCTDTQLFLCILSRVIRRQFQHTCYILVSQYKKQSLPAISTANDIQTRYLCLSKKECCIVKRMDEQVE